MTHYTVPNIHERLNVFQEVSLGGAVNFRCLFGAHPKAEVRWFKDDRPIIGDSRISIGAKPSEDDSCTAICQLTINEVTKDDEGSYRCSMENSEGVASTTGYLFVIDPSSSVIDPGPIDQSLIDALLQQASQTDLQMTSGHSRHSTAVTEAWRIADSIDKSSEENPTDTSKGQNHEPQIYHPSKLNGTTTYNSNNNNNSSSEGDDCDDKTIVNVYTILNADDNFHDSFRPIEIAEFERVEDQHIPRNVSINMLAEASSGERRSVHNNNNNSSSNNNNNNSNRSGETTTDMSAGIAVRSGSPDDLNTDDKLNYFQWQDDIDYSGATKDQASSGNGLQHRHSIQYPGELKRRKDYSKMTEWENLVKEMVSVKSDGRSDAKNAKNAKTLKWLKVKSGSSDSLCPTRNSGEDRADDRASIIAKRKSPRPSRKVCYDDEKMAVHKSEEQSTAVAAVVVKKTNVKEEPEQPACSTATRKSSPPKRKQQQQQQHQQQARFVREQSFSWNMAFTNLFKFPKVVGVFFVLTSTLVFLYLDFNPYLFTFLISLVWLFFIRLHPYLISADGVRH